MPLKHLSNFCVGKDLGLSEKALEILETQVNGRAYLKITKQDFRDIDIKAGAYGLQQGAYGEKVEGVLFVQELEAKYGIDGNTIRQFPPVKFLNIA